LVIWLFIPPFRTALPFRLRCLGLLNSVTFLADAYSHSVAQHPVQQGQQRLLVGEGVRFGFRHGLECAAQLLGRSRVNQQPQDERLDCAHQSS